MSLESGLYRITNRLAPLVLSLSQGDQRSVIAEDRESPYNQTWIIHEVDEGKVLIRSTTNDLSLGFPGVPRPGTKLIVDYSDIDKVWEVIRDGPDFKFRVPDTPFLIEFPLDNLRPEAPAQLGVPRLGPEFPNQVWTLTRVDDLVDEDEDDED